MCVEQPNNQATDRANGEIIFVALLTVSVIGIGAVGVSLGNDVTKDTTQRMQTPEFELDDRSDMEIAYEEGPLINNEEETETISLFDGENEYVVYDSNDNDDLEPGKPLATRSELIALGVEPGSTIQVVWTRKNGDSEVIDEVLIPDGDVYGGTYASPNGTINVSTDGVNGTVVF